jgi:hypothetical protein
MPSPLTSATTTNSVAKEPALYSTAGRNLTGVPATAIEKCWVLEAPPPGPGLTTVTAAEDAVAMSDARMVAVSLALLIKVVARGLPFQFTTDPATNPAPLIVRVRPGPPGAVASGTSG